MVADEVEYAVSVRNLLKRFGNFVAVNGINLDVARGEIFGFLGPNGAGKSTTIRMLCGLLSPDDGSGHVAGIDLRSQSEVIKNRIGYMSQKFSLYEDLTVEQNIDFYAGIYRIPSETAAAKKKWVIEMAGLDAHKKSLTKSLPGGWKQRLALGCAILHQPRLLFLDEPTSGVDPISRRLFWNLIYEMAESGVTVFVTTHYMDEAEFCDRVALIYHGEIIAIGTPLELKSSKMKGCLFEVDGPRQFEAMEMIMNIPEVREAALFGNGLHVVTNVPEDVEILSLALVNSGFSQMKITRIRPTLEDVFVSLIEEIDRSRKPVAKVLE